MKTNNDEPAIKALDLLACDELNHALRCQNEYFAAQLAILLKKQPKAVPLDDSDRMELARKGMALREASKGLFESTVSIFKPDTILRWHRKLIARKWDFSHRRNKLGRPEIDPETEALVLRLAEENPGHGGERISLIAERLGFIVSPTTARDILARHGMDPEPTRKQGKTWAQFIREHMSVTWACDFLTVEAYQGLVLTTFYVLIFIHHSTRRLIVAGMTPNPTWEWVSQQAKNVAAISEELAGAKYLIHDQDILWSPIFDSVMKSEGIKSILKKPFSLR